MAGVPSGLAADAARDAVELECRHGRGLELLDRILQTAPLPLTSCQVDRTGTRLDARGASALFLALPLAALAFERAPAPLTIRRLAHCAALEPALVRGARAGHWRVAVTAGDGTPVLRVDPSHSAIAAGWSAAWDSPLDVQLAANDAAPSPAAHPIAPAADRPAMVAPECWERLSERAAAYLV